MISLFFLSPRLFCILFSCFSWLCAVFSLYVQPVLPFTTTFLHIPVLFFTFSFFSLYDQPFLPFTTTVLHIILVLFLTFCCFFSLCSACSSFHHDFSSYSRAFLDLLLVFLYMFSLFFLSPRLFFIFSRFLDLLLVFLYMFSLFFLSPRLFLIFPCFSSLFAVFPLYVQLVLPFTATFLHIPVLVFTFCCFFFICSACSSFHHDFSSYSRAFLDLLLVFLYMFSLFFLSPRLFFIFPCFSSLFVFFLYMISLFFLSPRLFCILFSCFSWLFAVFSLYMFSLFFLSPRLFFVFLCFSWLFCLFLQFFKYSVSVVFKENNFLHICSKLCMVTFLSSISARYFHIFLHIINAWYAFLIEMHVKTSAPIKIEKLQNTFNALQRSKCVFPAFLQPALKYRKIGSGPAVSSPRTFLSFPGLLYLFCTFWQMHLFHLPLCCIYWDWDIFAYA